MCRWKRRNKPKITTMRTIEPPHGPLVTTWNCVVSQDAECVHCFWRAPFSAGLSTTTQRLVSWAEPRRRPWLWPALPYRLPSLAGISRLSGLTHKHRLLSATVSSSLPHPFAILLPPPLFPPLRLEMASALRTKEKRWKNKRKKKGRLSGEDDGGETDRFRELDFSPANWFTQPDSQHSSVHAAFTGVRARACQLHSTSVLIGGNVQRRRHVLGRVDLCAAKTLFRKSIKQTSRLSTWADLRRCGGNRDNPRWLLFERLA